MFSKIGAFLAIIGIFSTILTFTNYEVRILRWIEDWGPTTAWMIRIGLIVVGAILYFIGMRQTAKTSSDTIEN